MSIPRHPVAGALAAIAVIGLAACGSSSSGSSGGSAGGSSGGGKAIALKPGENPASQQLYGKKRGGTLNILSSQDFEHLDPGESYFSQDYAAMYATQRPLFIYPPNSSSSLAPDLATSVPTVANGGITDGGKTVTVHIQRGVHFSPPVNREVTSADVAYGIERGANPNVGSAYFPAYFGSASTAPLIGATGSSYKGGAIPGIQTPDKYTLVFLMTKPGATTLINALSLPASAPVPPEYAGPMDKHAPTTYGTQAEVATGPYMLAANAKTGVFAGAGYQTGKSALFVRNPNWNPNTYTPAYKPPAYLNQIKMTIGGDATVIGQQVLKGSHLVQLDTPAQSTVKLAYQNYPAQITFTPGSGDHYVSVDNQHGPFKNVDVRRALWAALDRDAIAKARGGSLVAIPMTHFIYPGNDGFTQAGGYAGPNVDYNQSSAGNPTVARKYMKAAGYASGKYTGSATVLIVGTSNGNDPTVTQIVNQAVTSLGFHTRVSLVDQSVMYAKYCGVPKQQIDACPTGGWIRDFADPLSVLFVPFYGPGIVPTNNSNWGQVNDPQINAAMVKASLVVDPTARAQAWANIDRMLVDKASAIPEEWDDQPNVESKDVAGVDDLWNEGTWDFAFTSLK
jgi:peptide/nickel transport system substrate-binding protein